MRKTYWCLDVDGVLNAWDLSGKKDPPGMMFQHTEIDGTPIHYRQTVIDFVNEMAARPDVTIVWTTDWTEKANSLLAPTIGLTGGWDVNPGQQPGESDWPSRAEWWKLRRVKRWLATGQKVVWTDDDILPRHKPKDSDALVIVPTPSRGLSDAHLRKIREFIDLP